VKSLSHYDADAIVSSVPVSTAIAILRTIFQECEDLHPRQSISLGNFDDLLIMPAVSPIGIGVKIVTVVSDNPSHGLPLIHAHYLFCDPKTGVPLATLDGSALTALRTPAVSALATDILAPSEPTTLGVFGTGTQARGHIEAMIEVRPSLESVIVYGRTSEKSQDFAAKIEPNGRQIDAGSADEAAACDIVCGCTSAAEPVIPTEAVQPGSHLNLVGSYSSSRREIGNDLVNLASVYVDNREAAMAEAGELIHASAGPWSFDQIVGDLGELVRGEVGRQHTNEITLFKSVGLAIEDVAIAAAVIKAGGD